MDGNPKKKAVCLLLISPQNKILVVARRGTTDKWGLPGGKVDPEEEPLQALIREVQEETLLKLKPEDLTSVFEAEENNFIVETFIYNGILNQVPSQGDAGPVSFVSWEELLSGAFSKYNLALKETIES